MKATCGVCGRPLERGDATCLKSGCVGAIHVACIDKPIIDDVRLLLVSLTADEIYAMRENLERSYTRLRAELDEVNACAWRCDNEITRRRTIARVQGDRRA